MVRNWERKRKLHFFFAFGLLGFYYCSSIPISSVPLFFICFAFPIASRFTHFSLAFFYSSFLKRFLQHRPHHTPRSFFSAWLLHTPRSAKFTSLCTLLAQLLFFQLGCFKGTYCLACFTLMLLWSSLIHHRAYTLPSTNQAAHKRCSLFLFSSSFILLSWFFYLHSLFCFQYQF